MAKTKVPGSYIADEAITSAHLHTSHGITTNNIGEHANNKYFTNARAIAALSASTGITISGSGAVATTITQYTTSLARATISVTDSGGDGSLAYNSTTGVMTYTGPSAAETRAHLSAGTGVGFSGGAISIGQPVATSNAVQFASLNLQGTTDQILKLTSTDDGAIYIAYNRGSDRHAYVGFGGSNDTFVITNEESSGTMALQTAGTTALLIDSSQNVTITGDLTVQGSQTTLNTATLDVEDKNITLNKGSGDTSSTADGAGITIQDAVNASNDATLLWNASGDKFVTSHSLDVAGTLASTTISSGSIVVTGTVDGRDVATDGTKLDGIEAGATTDQTQAEINALGITATGLSGTPNITVGTVDTSGKITISNSAYNNHLRIVRSGQGDLNLSPSGNQLLLGGGGFSPSSNNAFDLGRTDKYWQDLWLGSTLKMGGTTVLDSSKNLSSIGTISSGNITVGNSTTAKQVRAHHSDGAHMTLTGFGLEMNRGASYIRPTTDNTYALYVGGADASLDWNAIYFRSGNGLYMTGLQFLTSARNLVNIGTISSGQINSDAITITTGAVPLRFVESGYTGNGQYWRMPLDSGDLRFDVSTGGGASFSSYDEVFRMKSNGSILVQGSQMFDTTGSINTTRTIDSGAITSTGTVVASGNVQHTGLTMTSGTDIDQLYTATDSLTLSDAWQDTSIAGSDLASGTYIVQVYANDSSVGGGHYQEFYSGTMSWTSAVTNSNQTDEIILHRAGHAPNAGDIYLRTERRLQSGDSGTLMLQIRGSTTNSGASNYIFKFRRMI